MPPCLGRGPFPSLFRARVQGNRKGGTVLERGGHCVVERALTVESESWVQVSQCPGCVAPGATHPLWAPLSLHVK